MEIIKPGTQIPFTRYRYVAVVLSTLVNVGVLVLLFVKGPQLGVDFSGGTMVHVKFHKETSIPTVRQALARINLGDSVIQDFGQEGSNEYLIRLEKMSDQVGVLGEQIRRELSSSFGAGNFEILRIEAVGPKVGSELRQKGTWSVIAATIMMGVYIWVRFGTRFGTGLGLLF